MEYRPKILYPLMVIAAVAVTLFCGLGIAAMTGILPAAHSAPEAAEFPLPQIADPSPPDAGEPIAATCAACGTVESITPLQVRGSSSGIGAVAGGIAGALLGNGLGQGTGRAAMTILGGAGGAYAGNEIERNTHKSTSYRIRVRMEDGSRRTLYQHVYPGVAVGDRVKIVDGTVVARS